MRFVLTATALTFILCGLCRAEKTATDPSRGAATAGQEERLAGLLSPALLRELEHILQSAVAGPETAGEMIGLELAVLDDDERDRREGDRREGDRREGDRREGDRREGERGHERAGRDHDGDSRPGSERGHGGPGDHRHPGPGGPGHFGGPPHGPGGPGPHPHGMGLGGPGHNITVHVFVHHDLAGHPGMRRLHGDRRGPGAGRHERRRDDEEDEDDEEEEDDEDESQDSSDDDVELESLRDEVTSLRKELAELSGLVRRLANEGK